MKKALLKSGLSLLLLASNAAFADERQKEDNFTSHYEDLSSVPAHGLWPGRDKILEDKNDEIRSLKEETRELNDKIEAMQGVLAALEVLDDAGVDITTLLTQASDDLKEIKKEYREEALEKEKASALLNIQNVDLRAFQIALKMHGYLDRTKTADGDVGPATALAIEKFQSADLPSVDGVNGRTKLLFEQKFSQSDFSGGAEQSIETWYEARFDKFKTDNFSKNEEKAPIKQMKVIGDGWLKPSEARDLICKTAKAGLPHAQFTLARMYYDGDGFVKDLDKAKSLIVMSTNTVAGTDINPDFANVIKGLQDYNKLGEAIQEWLDGEGLPKDSELAKARKKFRDELYDFQGSDPESLCQNSGDIAVSMPDSFASLEDAIDKLETLGNAIEAVEVMEGE